MIRITRTAQYAIFATMRIAKHRSSEPVSARELAGDDIPTGFLSQILKELVKRGILKSIVGVAGGYRLSRKPTDISLLNIIEAIEGPPSLFDDLPPKPRRALGRANVAARNVLSKVTMADL